MKKLEKTSIYVSGDLVHGFVQTLLNEFCTIVRASGIQVLSEIFKSLKITAATQFHKQHGSEAIQ